MKICVLNGSPKGEISITMQYIEYLKNSFPEHDFSVIHIAHTLPKIERDNNAFAAIIEEVKASEAVIWAFPLYVCLVHGNYKRFIELIFERGAADAFKGKYTAAISTSIHFFDHTAHNYIHAICDDLDMRYTGYFSAYMDDIMKEGQKKNLILFFDNLAGHVVNQLPVQKSYHSVHYTGQNYRQGEAETAKIDAKGKKVLIISDIQDQGNLFHMTERFKNTVSGAVEHLDINRMRINGGCLGCMHCGYNNECVYGDKDDILDVYNNKIKQADIIVFALQVRDRFFSARFKTFMDRRFLNTHQPQMSGKQIGYIISGPFSQTPNIAEICRAMAELDQANLCGIITDENIEQMDLQIDTFAAKLVKMASENYIAPQSFLGIGGAKIFRDEIFLQLRFVFLADHRYYKKHHMYDFPQKKIGIRLVVFFMSVMSKIPPFRKYVQKNMKTLMLQPYKKAVQLPVS